MSDIKGILFTMYVAQLVQIALLVALAERLP